MIGIKGTGMSALAVNFKHMGIGVTGSDHAESFFTDTLLKYQGIKVFSPFSPKNIPADTELVVVSTAYNNKNIEVQEAKRRNLTLLTYPQALGLLTKQLPSVAICGSHGKTTTSGALGFMLSKTAYRPIVNVGSIVPQLLRYKARKPKLLIFEADEYQNKFEYFYPKIVLMTNIDYDHPDFFSDPAHYKNAFRNFIKRIPRDGLLIYCADDKNCRDVARYAKCKKTSYGFSKYADHQIGKLDIKINKMKFNVAPSQDPQHLAMAKNWVFISKLIGRHNTLNLTATVLCAAALDISAAHIKKAIASFTGTKRRLEKMKETRINGHHCIVIDDFGHHPTEIKATIATLKTAYPDRTLWTVFQPHTFSRTEALFDDFAKCFEQSNKTIILDIYASKRETTGPPKFSYGKPRRVNKIHSRDLVKKINSPDVIYKPDIMTAAKLLKTKIKTPSIILTLGASEVWRLVEFL
ncbi:MAG: UDP-N-acetylmuramate--L-alanine ligase [Candidatus Yanofskybacteria bacterium]|nr:UDP-N-acetylmuramate--L-alanine ligase [Candidatus Yanofskybacteria bacterium]